LAPPGLRSYNNTGSTSVGTVDRRSAPTLLTGQRCALCGFVPLTATPYWARACMSSPCDPHLRRWQAATCAAALMPARGAVPALPAATRTSPGTLIGRNPDRPRGDQGRRIEGP